MSISDLEAREGFLESVQALCLFDRLQTLLFRQVCREFYDGACFDIVAIFESLEQSLRRNDCGSG
jgi:hypothetical protein